LEVIAEQIRKLLISHFLAANQLKNEIGQITYHMMPQAVRSNKTLSETIVQKGATVFRKTIGVLSPKQTIRLVFKIVNACQGPVPIAIYV
jgi:hypothetical protein